MSQSQLVIDFPVKASANAKALTEELPPLMPDFARVQDGLRTVHFSRFLVEGDEKLLFLSEIDGETDQHIDRLVESAGPVLDLILTHVDDPPATPVVGNTQEVSKWMKHHVHKGLDTFFAYGDASVEDIKAAARAAGFEGNTLQSPLLIYMSIKSLVHAFAMNLVKARVGKKGHKGLEAVGTVHFADWVPFEHNHLGFFTIFDGDFAKYVQDFADETSFVFDAVFHHVDDAPPTPVAKNPQAFYQWALEANHPPIGFYSAYPGLSVQDIRALLADRKSQSR